MSSILSDLRFALRLPLRAPSFSLAVIVGGGKPGLPGNIRVELELLDERRFGNGVVYMHHGVR